MYVWLEYVCNIYVCTIYVCMCAIDIYMFICMYVCMYVSMYVRCMCVCVTYMYGLAERTGGERGSIHLEVMSRR